MSEFTKHNKKRVDFIISLYNTISEKRNTVETIKQNQHRIDKVIPSDIIFAVDQLVRSNIPFDELKTGINKLLNILYATVKNSPYSEPLPDSYFDCCIKNNNELDKRLKSIRPLLKQLNKTPLDIKIRKQLADIISGVLEYEKYYQIKENVIFPFIENQMDEYRCLQLMWSFHDDIRRNLKDLNQHLLAEKIELKPVNRLFGDIFFNMYAIIFREERILFPFMEEITKADDLNSLFKDSLEIGFPYYTPVVKTGEEQSSDQVDLHNINLKSGNLTAEQIVLLFNHLPVDITFVDENNKVKFFSTPKKRIFPRTNAIIGRDVHNCHPPESVHVVEEIIEAFKSGKKDKASFWIRIKGELILIRYFAMYDLEGNYKGVIEVSQEVSEIQGLEGEKRLLDWT
ncbi:MAG: PAS domain-containing protein [Bacteroidota bacterium]|nr:PAS domain-containing protein [Bacteroidota bacterium]